MLCIVPRYSDLGVLAAMAPSVVEASAANGKPAGNTLNIEKLGLNLPIGTKESDLKKGAWQRYAERSNPVKGGNIVLAGHRFELGWTPSQTKKRSPFYKLNILVPGDVIKIMFEGKPYRYIVQKTYHVLLTDTWIEDDSVAPKLTIYTCDLGGSDQGRLVVEAVPAQE